MSLRRVKWARLSFGEPQLPDGAIVIMLFASRLQ
jgi:hypothetical protein